MDAWTSGSLAIAGSPACAPVLRLVSPPPAEHPLLGAVQAAARVDVILPGEVPGRSPAGHCLVADAGPAGGLWLRVLHVWLTTDEDLLETVEARLRAAGLAVWSVPRGRREGELFVRAIVSARRTTLRGRPA